MRAYSACSQPRLSASSVSVLVPRYNKRIVIPRSFEREGLDPHEKHRAAGHLRARGDRTARVARVARLRHPAGRPRPRPAAARARSATSARSAGVALPFTADTPYVNTHPRRRGDAAPRQPGDRAPHQEPRPLERDGDGRARQPAVGRASAATSRPTPRRRRSTRSASTTSSAARSTTATATSSTSRATPRPASTRARFSKAGCRSRSCTTSAASSPQGGGLSSYPHPWLMPDFWEFPTVSMGLGPIMSIYQARFNRYLEDRGLQASRRTPRSGPSSATARPTSPNRSARSASRRARSSTT